VEVQTRVNVPDERFDWLVGNFQPKSEVQPYLEIVDIAGLVKGAAQEASLSVCIIRIIFDRPLIFAHQSQLHLGRAAD
jgi:hypothetical protein